MIGDDLPDEAALETATRLGGLALKVGASVAKTVRSSFATRRMCAGGLTTSQRRLIHDHALDLAVVGNSNVAALADWGGRRGSSGHPRPRIDGDPVFCACSTARFSTAVSS